MYPIQINFKLFRAFHADFLWNYLSCFFHLKLQGPVYFPSHSFFFFSTKPKITRNKNQFTRINTNSKTSFSIIGALYAHS